jgi:hypothetical protein
MEENKQQQNQLSVEFSGTQKKLSYSGSLGELIGNTLTLLQMLYRSIRNSKNRLIFKREITKIVQEGIVFMSNEDIEETIKRLSKKDGETNE